MRNLKVVFPEGSAFDNYKFTIDEEELEKDFDEKDEELEENLEKDEKI